MRQHVVLEGRPERPAITTPKTRSSVRTLEIDTPLIEERERQRATRTQAAHWFDHGLVFCTRYGTPHNPNNVLDSCKTICRRAGIDPIDIHTLRHTNATHLRMVGLPLAVISRRLGHARESITLDRYSHELPGYESLALDALRRALHADVPELEG